MACNQCNSSCSDCGCLQNVPSKCVFVQNTYSCLDVTKGDTLEDVLASLNTKLCNIPTPSGTTYVGTSNQIVVTGNVISLSPTITSNITNLNTSITNLQNCVSASLNTLTVTPGSGLSLTESSSNSCGKTYNLNYTPTSLAITAKQGIIENYTSSQIIPSGFTITKDLSVYDIKSGDLIKITGGIRKIVLDSSDQEIIVTDGVTSISLTAGSMSPYRDNNKFIDFEILLPVSSVAGTNLSSRVKAKFDITLSQSGVSTEEFTDFITFGKKLIQKQLPSVFDISTFRLIFNNGSSTILENLIIELIRKI